MALNVVPLAPTMFTAMEHGAILFNAALQQGVTLYLPHRGLCTGLKACLRNYIRINKYLHSDPNAQARNMARQ